MGVMRKEDYLELGRMYAQEGKPQSALKSLHLALLKYIGGENSPVTIDERVLELLPSELLSYYGFCIAVVEGRIPEGIAFCKNAISRDILRPEFYLNLGRVYLEAKQKAKALETFQRGLEITEKNSELMQQLKDFGVRKKPVLHFIPRGSFLNRYLGLLFHRVEGRSNGKKKTRHKIPA